MKTLFIAIAACMSLQGQAFALDFGHGHFEMARADTDNKARISLSEATQMVQQRFGGRILAAQEMPERNAYRIKVLTPQGEVRVVIVDAETGRME